MFKSPTLYIEKQLRQVLISLKKLKHSNKSEEIHRLRVSIKKIRAMLKMVEETSKTKISSRPLKKVFDDAGVIREYSVNTSLLEKYKMQQPTVILLLRKDVIKYEKKFKTLVPQYILSLGKLGKQKKLRDLSWPDDKKIKKYFEINIKELTKKKINSRKKLHQFRKRIKRLMYVFEAMSVSKKKMIGLNLKFIDQLQNKVGKWHDLRSATLLIRDLKLEKKKVFASILKKEKKEFSSMLSHLKLKPGELYQA